MHEKRTDMTVRDAYAKGWAPVITCKACGHRRIGENEELANLPAITLADYAARHVCRCGANDVILGMRQAKNPRGSGSWVPES